MGDGITVGMSFESATSLNNRFSNRTGIKPDYMRRQAEGGISDRTLYKDKKDVVYAEYTNFSGGDVAKYNKKYNKTADKHDNKEKMNCLIDNPKNIFSL